MFQPENPWLCDAVPAQPGKNQTATVGGANGTKYDSPTGARMTHAAETFWSAVQKGKLGKESRSASAPGLRLYPEPLAWRPPQDINIRWALVQIAEALS
jgi:hypothetical protein